MVSQTGNLYGHIVLVVLKGTVESYFLKQLALEAIRPLAIGLRIENELNVEWVTNTPKVHAGVPPLDALSISGKSSHKSTGLRSTCKTPPSRARWALPP